ncbi:heavy metal translocating P-type ATPase [Pelagibius sp. Alg239-R121]|uniref:heavy metal translocating P-type ATPase n=1 Tax=Pelagibius sp. Alg239-R121 TaxID=2993448 RepID=UPI0024A7089F|nr:heavy metal translocating P-type ATPase [Pelagibius sp. Alg239-R121]
MTCCETQFSKPETNAISAAEDQFLVSRDLGEGLRQTDLSVPGIHCAGCIASIEKMFAAMPGVASARVNFSLKRVAVQWRPADNAKPDLIAALNRLGYDAHLFSPETVEEDPEFKRLIRALAVSGFAAMNIMLLSVSIWSGAEGSTRQAFHWLSAIIAVPAVAYAGRIFFASAWSALRHGRSNMDVPISVGVILAIGLSLYDTRQDAPHAYFDAATSLLFFLLIGRTLDHAMRRKARSAVSGLIKLMPRGATVIGPNEIRSYRPLETIAPGTTILVAAGERIPLDGIVLSGRSEIDRSLVTGESEPATVAPGADLQAGALNLTGDLKIRSTKDAEGSFVSEMIASMLTAENARARFRSLAERATAYYSPVVHTLALLAFIGWYFASGDLHSSLTIAIAVLIITCPCALGLAVPMVQVAAGQRLFKRGILVKNGSALERLAGVDSVFFDKTGTLTRGRPSLVDTQVHDSSGLPVAASIARHSIHPFAKAISNELAASEPDSPGFDSVEEHAGLGLEARSGSTLYRLGRPDWALSDQGAALPISSSKSLSVLGKNGQLLAAFTFSDRLRADCEQTVRHLAGQQLQVRVLSGDRKAVVEKLADDLSIECFSAELLPIEKLEQIEQNRENGHRVLMVGDGLNDAPALAAANVSIVPATAADAGRDGADLVFTRQSLLAVPQAIAIAKRAVTLIKQNFWLAVIYNALAIPFAIGGYVTPLIAAVSMSLSSVLVVANSFRFNDRSC